MNNTHKSSTKVSLVLLVVVVINSTLEERTVIWIWIENLCGLFFNSPTTPPMVKSFSCASNSQPVHKTRAL
jgi:hypothetical protein